MKGILLTLYDLFSLVTTISNRSNTHELKPIRKCAKLMEILLNCYGHNIHANQQTKCLSINKDNRMTKHGARIE
jgi:hypothetical protein